MIINIKHANAKYDIYIGRGSRYGNPYTVEDYGREEAIRLYKTYLWKRIQDKELKLEELAKLHEKRLGCYCFPKRCHGEVLEKAAEWAVEQLKK